MKRLIIIAMMLAAFTASQAQGHFNAGKESKAVSADALEKGTYVGRYDDNDVWLNSVRKGWRVTVLNRDLEVVQTAEMEIKADRLLAATMNGNTATLLLSSEDKRRTDVLVAHLSLEGESTVDTLDTYQLPNRKDKCMLWGARSFLGNYMAVVAVRQFRDSSEYVSTAYLVSSRGNMVYGREFAMTSFDQVIVTDDGRIATLGIENTDAGVDVMVNYVSSNVNSTGRYTMDCDPIRDVRLVNVVGNRLLGIGTTYARKRRNDKVINGTLTFAYDLDSNKVYDYEAHNFTLEDVNTLYNNYFKKKQRHLTAENVAVLGSVPTSYGGAMAITRSFVDMKSTNDGVVHHTYMNLGIHMVGVNVEGKVAWVYNIRCNDNQENSNDDLRIGLSSDGDNIYVYKNESRKDPAEYDFMRVAKAQKAGKRGNLVRYRISNGDIPEKLVLERKSKHAFLLVTDAQEIFTVNGRKVRRGTVSEIDDAVEEVPAEE